MTLAALPDRVLARVRRLPDATLNRMVGLAVGLPAWSVLGIALWLRPDPAGFGTHRQLGLGACVVLAMTGVPCPMCGMTTTFSHLAHGHLVQGALTQPFGVVLFSLTVLAAGMGALDLVLGRGLWRQVLQRVAARESQIALGITIGLLAGWIYKIVVVLSQ